LWHSSGKHLIARWATGLPDVYCAQVEDWLANGSRRADVIVTFADGRRLAIELQNQLLPDPDRLARHRSYAARDITDVSLWHPRIR
jgi:hypothetical protein